jgi:hypothetical protein
MTWTIKRIEALRWRLMVRYEEVVRPAYYSAVDNIHEMGGAYYEFRGSGGKSLERLVPVKASNRSRRTVRREIPRVHKSLPPLTQLASVANPSKEELEAGARFMLMKAWRNTYHRRIDAIGERLFNTVLKEELVTQTATPRVLKINGRYYPVRWGNPGYRDRLHLWWPHPKREATLLEVE